MKIRLFGLSKELFYCPKCVNIFTKEPFLEDALKLFESENLRLIKSLPAQYVEQLRGKFVEAVKRGTRWEDVAKEIREILPEKLHNRANLIARDQIGKLNAQLTLERQKNIGVTHYIWRGMLDERERPAHREREGKVFEIGHVHDDGLIGEAVLCRCYAEMVLPEFDDLVNVVAEGVEPVEPKIDTEKVQTETVNDFLSAFRGGTIDNQAVFDKAGEAFIKERGLTRAEATATRIYTNHFYQDINYFYYHPEFQSQDPRFAQVKAMADLIDKMLDKLPKVEGVMHRYTWFDDNILAQHQVGNEVTYEAFTSTSHTRPAEHFKASSNVYLRITSKSGREIEPISAMENEREVLFKRGCRFKVNKVTLGADGMTEIEIKEL